MERTTVISIAKYKGVKIIVKQVGKRYEIYPFGEDGDNELLPLDVSTSDKHLLLINVNRMGPRELRETLKEFAEEIVVLNDEHHSELDRIDTAVKKNFGVNATEVYYQE